MRASKVHGAYCILSLLYLLQELDDFKMAVPNCHVHGPVAGPSQWVHVVTFLQTAEDFLCVAVHGALEERRVRDLSLPLLGRDLKEIPDDWMVGCEAFSIIETLLGTERIKRFVWISTLSFFFFLRIRHYSHS